MFLCLSCTHCLGRQGFFHLLRQIHFHPSSCTPVGWPGRTASVGSCWVPSMEGTGRKRVTERSGYSLPQTLLSWPSFSTEVKLLSDGCFATLRLWLNSSQFDWIRACPFKFRGSNGHSPSSSLLCFTIPPDSLLLAMSPHAPLLIFFNGHLEWTFCGDPSTMLHYQEWIKRHLNFCSDSLACSHVTCLVCNQLPSREMSLWEALGLTYISPSSDTVPSCLHQPAGRGSLAGLCLH